MTKAERITGAELARRLGVSKQAIGKARDTGRIKPGVDGLYEFDGAASDLKANTRRGNNKTGLPKDVQPLAGSRAPGAEGNILTAELEKLVAYTEGLRLKNEKLADGLVDREVAEKETARLALEFRDRFLAFCQREAPLITAVAQGGDAGDVRRYLDKQARLELESMSDGILSLVASRDDSDEDPGADA